MKKLLVFSLTMFVLGTFILGGVALTIDKKDSKISYVKKSEVKNILILDAKRTFGSCDDSPDNVGTYVKANIRLHAPEVIPVSCLVGFSPQGSVKHCTAYINNYKSVYLNHRNSDKSGIYLRQSRS